MWCHHAMAVEATLDRNDGTSAAWTGWDQWSDRARQEIAVADRYLSSAARPDPGEWAHLAREAVDLHEQLRRHVAA